MKLLCKIGIHNYKGVWNSELLVLPEHVPKWPIVKVRMCGKDVALNDLFCQRCLKIKESK